MHLVRSVFFLAIGIGALGSCVGNTGGAPPQMSAGAQDVGANHDLQTLLVRYAEAQKDIEEKKQQLEAMEERILAEPWPFPEQVDPELEPTALLPRLRDAAVHAGYEAEFLEPDCSEYPCIYVARSVGTGRAVEFWKAASVVDLTDGRNTVATEQRPKACRDWAFMATIYSTPLLRDLLSKRIKQRITVLKETVCPEG